ncbi:MAG: 1,2-phenylacetyl-CoA epoxidase subunit PaaC [Chloroflexota bacterium]
MTDTAALDLDLQCALVAYLLPWADDELILGHRDSEWTGFAPMLEEDLAFSSIAQDEIGHAALIYGLIGAFTGDSPDLLALDRPANGYLHTALVERPNGDWAHTIARHYLYDLADAVRLEALSTSNYAPLAGIARKMAREEHYHRMHGELWWDRLANGTSESRERLIAAVGEVLPLTLDILAPIKGSELLLSEGILPQAMEEQRARWREQVRPLPAALDYTLPTLLDGTLTMRAERPPSPTFLDLHAELTMVSGSGMGLRW